ncbi:PspC domain-containing protein [Zafaria sp. Z1313]|uniref:ATP-binding protein n=1 Tax=unclassified Zafaria TaxID=2828765 RepID=UPI002E77D840|nr:PspC domain-containing protein [Zafaria sp. J156]MEE1620588.1 PspC domain-containing protein [Zafaria sp. J156]
MTETIDRPPLVRGGTRLVAGVCAGIARHLGLEVRPVRIAMAVAAVFGPGLLLYAWLWILLPNAEDAERDGAGRRTSLAERLGAQGAASGPFGRTAAREVLLGVALLGVGALLVAQMQGLAIAWNLLWPLVIVVAGAIIAWLQLDTVRRDGLKRSMGAQGAAGVARLVGGLGLVVVGLVFLVSGAVSVESLWTGALVSLVVLAGVVLVLLPWGLGFWRDYAAERASRIRASERAEIAAHLHDSVLQTLALIQKRAGDEAQVLRLARAQERELRQWLYQDAPSAEGDIGEAVRGEAARLEESHDAVIEVVVVGRLSGLLGHDALLQATREAMLNAAKHAGGTVSVYVEARADGVDVFVRDRGRGFDVDAVGEDRLGVRESIIGRMQRNGGSAAIRSSPDGTEVRLSMPHEPDGTEDKAGTP